MAILIPNLEAAKTAKQKPTDGEIFLLGFLKNHFGDQVEVYFQPCFNGDRPDIVLISPKEGVIIIEVKDWNLDIYSVDEKNKWAVDLPSGQQPVKPPFAQVFAYKKNFFDIHVNGLLEKSLKNDAFFKMIKTFVYFHHGNKMAIEGLYKPHLDRLRDESRENEDAFKKKQIDFGRYERRREGINRAKHKFERDMSLSLHKTNLAKISFPITAKKSVFDES